MRERNAGGDREEGHHAADHDELALREIDHVGSVVDQREPERDQRIDRTDHQPGKQELQEFGHSYCCLSKGTVMPALVAGIHVLVMPIRQDVDGRDKPGHDARV